MSYVLFMMTGALQHPPMGFETFDQGLEAIENALLSGAVVVTGEDDLGDNVCVTLTGPGTIYRLMPLETGSQLGIEQRMRQARLSQGLIAGAPANLQIDKPYRIIILHNGNQVDVELAYSDFKSAEAAALDARTGSLKYRLADKDFFCIQPGTGTVFLVLTKDAADRRRWAISEQRMRAATLNSPPRISPSS
jgi:hypothetical protein